MNNLLFSGYTKPKRREFIHEARSQPPAAQQHATGDRTSPHYWNWADHTASWPSQGGQPVRTKRVTWSKTILNKLEKGHFLRPFLLLNFIHWCRVTFVFIVYIDGIPKKRLTHVSIDPGINHHGRGEGGSVINRLYSASCRVRLTCTANW